MLFKVVMPVVVVLAFNDLIFNHFDEKRIDDYLKERNNRLLFIKLHRSDKFKTSLARMYLVEYEDWYGNLHRAIINTSQFYGVTIHDDKIIEYPTVLETDLV